MSDGDLFLRGLAIADALRRLHSLGLHEKLHDLDSYQRMGLFTERWVVIQNDRNKEWSLVQPKMPLAHALEIIGVIK